MPGVENCPAIPLAKPVCMFQNSLPDALEHHTRFGALSNRFSRALTSLIRPLLPFAFSLGAPYIQGTNQPGYTLTDLPLQALHGRSQA
jgi:hypothetical protein